MSDKSHMQTIHLSPYVSARGTVDELARKYPPLPDEGDRVANLRNRVEIRQIMDDQLTVLVPLGELRAVFTERDAQTARADAAEAEVARLRGLVESAEGIFTNCQTSAGVCCCGENMDGHSNPMECGHSPVDIGEYSASQWIAALQLKAWE